jgi:hypothetical protein
VGGRLAWPALQRTALVTVAVLPAVMLAPSAAPAQPSPRPACPSGTDRVASHSVLEIDAARGRATVAFVLADGCQDVQVSLASYRLTQAAPKAGGPAHEQLLYDAATGLFSAGEVHQLTAAVDPVCYHHVTFILGAPADRFEPGAYEAERARTISSRVEGGPRPCATPPPRTPAQVRRTPAPPVEPAPPGAAAPGGAAPPAPTTTTAAPPAGTPEDPAALASTPDARAGPAVDPGKAAPAAARRATSVPTTTAPGAEARAATAPAAQADPGPAETLPFTGPGLRTLLLAGGLILLGGGALALAGGPRPLVRRSRPLVSGSRARVRPRTRAGGWRRR